MKMGYVETGYNKIVMECCSCVKGLKCLKLNMMDCNKKIWKDGAFEIQVPFIGEYEDETKRMTHQREEIYWYQS